MKTAKIFIGVLLLSSRYFTNETGNAQHIERGGKFMSQMPDYGQADTKRVDEFLREFKKFTFHIFSREKRTRELDNCIRNARLNLAEKIEVFKRLAPPVDITGHRDELRMERLLLSVAPEDLPLFKSGRHSIRGYWNSKISGLLKGGFSLSTLIHLHNNHPSIPREGTQWRIRFRLIHLTHILLRYETQQINWKDGQPPESPFLRGTQYIPLRKLV